MAWTSVSASTVSRRICYKGFYPLKQLRGGNATTSSAARRNLRSRSFPTMRTRLQIKAGLTSTNPF